MTAALKTAAPLPLTTAVNKAGALSDVNYSFLQRFIQAESGIMIGEDKRYLLESRLVPLIREEGIDSLNTLVNLLTIRTKPMLARKVIESMTTHETLFFRDPIVFDSLRQHVLPNQLAELKHTRKLRIWSAAASTGQEAYSVAMLLLEMQRHPEEVEIVATDLSTQVLERARQGRYLPFEVQRGLPPNYLNKYFDQQGSDWVLQDRVRRMVTFRPLDLRRDLASMGTFDLIFCRNVLIYFDTATKVKILDALRSALTARGSLVLGCAETVMNLHNGFKRTTLGQAHFYTSASTGNVPRFEHKL